MPRKSKSAYKRPGYKSCGKMVYSDAAKALKLARTVKSMLNVEYNLMDTIITSTASPVTPAVVQLSNIVQGDTNITRDGNQIKVTHIQLKYFFTINASAVQTCVRILLVQDKQTNGTAHTGATVLKNVTVFDNVNSPYLENTRRRFRILYDRVHDLSDSGNKIGRGTKNIRLNLPIRYAGNAGTIADITENSLELIHMSTEASNTPLLHCFCRLLFVDN